jgi:hypothetical protein
MFILNVILSVFLFVLTFAMIHKLYHLRQRENALSHVGGELDNRLTNLRQIAKERKTSKLANPNFLGDADILSSLITTIVTKYGTLQLELEDFANVDNGAYVSIYVNADEETLLLSTNHNLTETEDTPLGLFNLDPDDTIFH